jgi:hypothetical protein
MRPQISVQSRRAALGRTNDEDIGLVFSRTHFIQPGTLYIFLASTNTSTPPQQAFGLLSTNHADDGSLADQPKTLENLREKCQCRQNLTPIMQSKYAVMQSKYA